MANPAPTINQINAFNATQGTTIDFNIIGGTELIRSNRIYIYDLSDNSLICTHLYVSTESIHELPPNTDGSIVYESGKSSADFVNGAQYYAQIQTYTDTNGTQGGSGLSVAKMFWCLGDPTLTVTTIPSTISTTSYNVSATYTDTSASVVSNIIQQYQFNLYSATGSLLQSSGVVVGSGTQQGTSDVYDISYNFTGLNVGSSYYVTIDVTTTQGMSVNAQSGTFTVSIDTPTLGEATVVNNACDGYISVTSNLSGEYGGSGSGEIVSFETDSEDIFTKLQVGLEPIQEGSGNPSPSNVRPIRGHSGVTVYDSPTQNAEDGESYSVDFNVSLTPTSTDTTPYSFKAVGDVYGDRLEDKIVGGTVAWNQQLKLDRVANHNGITASLNNDGGITINGTATSDAYISIDSRYSFKLDENHKYLYKGCPSGGSSMGYFLGDGWSGMGRDYGKGTVFTATSGTFQPNIIVVKGNTVSNLTFRPQLFDLTQMFGSTIADYIYSLEQATAGAGVAWFKKLFPKDYYAYNAGELLSVGGLQSHDTVGFNQWDEEWEVGYLGYSSSNEGQPIPMQNNTIRSKNFIKVLPNTSYYFKYPIAEAHYVWEYDENKNALGHYQLLASGNNNPFTTPSDCHYIKFACEPAYGNTYNHDICINLSNPTRNGEYEPYKKHSYPLDSSLTLRGIPKLDASKNLYYDGDEYTSDGKVKRKYGVVDLGTLNWAKGTHSGVDYFVVSNVPSGSRNGVCPIYTKTIQDGVAGMQDKEFLIYNDASQVFIVDSSYTDAATFKAAMNGVMLVYELATPTTETATPYTNPQIVSKYGTLEYVTNSIVPVGHKTTYLTRDIFGGYVDLISGKLVVDKAMVDLGSLEWRSNQTGVFYTVAFNSAYMPQGGTSFVANALCTQYVVSARETVVNQDKQFSFNYSDMKYITVHDTAYTNATTFKSAMNGVQLVYELATPQTYQLTPQQVNTLVGTNNVWSEQGNIELSYHIPITNLLVKRQDVDDVSGGWLTLYSQPITQASDMDFTFIDFLNQYGKTYKYALVPLLTQTQSGVEVEVEGGYTVSNEVQSVFDGVFIADSTGSQKCKANVGYGNVDMNQVVGSITPIGAKYPIIITNSHNQYHNGSISGTIVPDDYYFNGNLSRIDMVNKRNELEQFLTNKRVKVIKDWNGNIWLVMIGGNVSCTFNNNYGMGIVDFSTNWIEVGDPTNQQDLQATGLINVGGV